MKRFYRFLLALSMTGFFALLSYLLLWGMSRKIYAHCSFVYFGGVEMVRKGEVLHFMYGEMLAWSTLEVFLLSLVWAFTAYDMTIHPNIKHLLFTSTRMKMGVGILFVFSSLGMMFIKGGDIVEQIFAIVNLILVVLLAIWFIAKEIYLIQHKGMRIGPNKASQVTARKLAEPER